MKIHSICLAKNEADIIAQTLIEATKWSDYIYVVDNGSDDGTWQIILDCAGKNSQIIAHKQDKRTYYDGMRAEIFHEFRKNSNPGDWWCRLDADEIYIDDPRLFLSDVEKPYQAVWAASFQYYFTNKDLERYEQNAEHFSNDVPVEEKCRYYLNNWSENRFFKYDQRIVWDTKRGWPYFGAICPSRIRMKHYQYRSPQQIQQRLAARLEARAKGWTGFSHEAHAVSSSKGSGSFSESNGELSVINKKDLWKHRIVDAAELDFDSFDGSYVTREELMPPVPRSFFPSIENRTRYLKRYINRSTLNRLPFIRLAPSRTLKDS